MPILWLAFLCCVFDLSFLAGLLILLHMLVSTE